MAVRYCQEHMSRVLRQGFVTEVMNSEGDLEKLVKLRGQWAKHGLPTPSLTRLGSAMLRVRSAQLR